MAEPKRYKKPTGSSSLPTWYKQIRAGADFMPAKIRIDLKPASYNYMARMETPNRKAVYGASGVPPLLARPKTTPMLRTDVGTYFAPTPEVAKGIQKNNTIIDSIKTLGGEVKSRGATLLTGAMDLVSRPQYAVFEAYKNNLDYWTRGSNSLGGERVTGQEHALAALGTVSGLGLVMNAVSGRADDSAKDMWAGFSGKKKTQSIDILKQQTPGFVLKHPKAARNLGIGGDIIIDPLNLFGVVTAPGSITKAVGAGGLKLAGKSEAAAKLYAETFFSKGGREASLNVFRQDIIQSDLNKLGRKVNKVNKNKTLVTRKARYTPTEKAARQAELSAAIATKAKEDLKGLQFAMRGLQKSIPTLGIGTAARLSVGAKHVGTAQAASRTIQGLHDAAVGETVAALKQDDHWKVLHEELKNTQTDLKYTHNGETYTVPIKDDLDEWLTGVAREAAPIANYAEPNAKAARSRRGRIFGVEARSNAFINSLGAEFRSAVNKGLTRDELAELDKMDSMMSNAAKAPKMSATRVNDPESAKWAVVTEDDLKRMTYDELNDVAKQARQDAGKTDTWRSNKAQVIVKFDDDTYRLVKIDSLNKSAKDKAARRTAKAKAEAKSATNPIEGATPRAARAATRTIDAVTEKDRAAAAAEVASAGKGTGASDDAVASALSAAVGDPDAMAIVKTLNGIMSSAETDNLPEAAKAALAAIMDDPTKTPAEKVAEILNSDILGDATTVEAMEDIIGNVKGATNLHPLAQIFRNVIADRWGARVTTDMEKASGISLDAVSNTLKKIKKTTGTTKDYTRDINSEIAIMAMDAYKLAVDHAVRTQRLLENPDELFDVINSEMTEFLNMATAETKVQVMQMMYNMSGIRLPEDFVPTHSQIDAIRDNFTFMGANGKPANQEQAWINMALVMQRWAVEMFPDIDVPRTMNAEGKPIARGGVDMDAFAVEVAGLASRRTEWVAPATHTPQTRNLEQVAKLRADIDTLPSHLEAVGSGVTVPWAQGVNRYTMLDFIMHNTHILKAQSTTIRTTSTPAGIVKRVEAGRLSALDSFTFTDKEAEKGIEAIGKLQSLANSSNPAVKKAAQEELAHLFVQNGGLEYLAEVSLPASGSFATFDPSGPLKRLGVHARLKEEPTFNDAAGAKQRADLMEHMWGTQTLLHEWQKAMQNKILHEVYINGRTHEETAKRLSENVKAAFLGHKRITNMLYPVMRNATIAETDDMGNIISTSKGLKAKAPHIAEGDVWGRPGWPGSGNPLSARQHSPMTETTVPAEHKLTDAGDPKVSVRMPDEVTDYPTARRTLHEQISRMTKSSNKGAAQQLVDALLPARQHIKSYDWVILTDDEGKLVGIASTYKVGTERVYQNRLFKVNDKKVVNLGSGKLETQLRKQTTPTTTKARHEPQVAPKDYAPGAVLDPNTINKPPMPGKQVYDPNDPSLQKAAELMQATEAAKVAKADGMAAVAEHANDVKGTDSQVIPDPVDEGVPPPVTEPETAPVDNPNISDGSDLDLTDIERSAIVDFIRSQYVNATPAQVAYQVDRIGMALSADLMEAQKRLLTQTQDYSIKHGRNIQIAGIPFIPVSGPINATHSLAGITALDTQRAGAFRFLRDRFQRVQQDDQVAMTGAQKFMNTVTRQSQVLEGSLERIRMGVVNRAAMERKSVIDTMNNIYVNGVNKGVFKSANVTAMNKRQRRKYLQEAFFDPQLGIVPDRLDDFVDPTGQINPARLIEARLNATHDAVFSGLTGGDFRGQWKTFNNYLQAKYRITDKFMDEIDAEGINIKYAPYTRNWFIAVNRSFGDASPFKNLAQGNLADLHYSIEDARLKIQAGRDLQNAVWDEFSWVDTPKNVRYYNSKIQPTLLDVNDKPMRGKYVSLDELTTIDNKYIPGKYRRVDRYIREDQVKDLRTLFEYMDNVGRMSEQLNVGFLDKILSYFKASVTIYKIPTYPVKNTISDVFMSMMDGVVNPLVYRDAAEIVMGNHQAMQGINVEDYRGILDDNFLNSNIARASHDPASVKQIGDIAPQTGTRLTLMIEGQPVKLNDVQIMRIYDELGLGQNRVAGEFVETVEATRMRKSSMVGGAVHDRIKNLNDVREDWARVAHFLDAMKKEAPLGGSLDDVMRRAGDRVIKYHFDYGDVSLWERNTLARNIPFYKWVKNIIPFTITAMVTTPRFLNLEQEIGEFVGNNLNDNPQDEGYKDFVLPEYIARENAIPIGWFMNEAGNKFNQYAITNLPLSETLSKTIAPTVDPWINGQFDSIPKQGLASGGAAITTGLSMTNPLIKGAIQAATGKTIWSTGASPQGEDDSWLKTMAAIIPGFPALNDAQKALLPDEKLAGYSNLNKAGKIADNLGAINVVSNTESAQIGSLMKTQDRHAGMLKKRKAEVAKMVLEKYPNLSEEQASEVVNLYLKEVKKNGVQ